jgi:hypothetical protein|uniref:Major capsid protein n=1 Tax=Podoviridae sp. ctiuS14 TaxID=2827620 RepID=A0A8S5LMG3_9CAUD|nr:MAG TPA: major capsid protein [Podoviridae sp. ctiuS14]
MATFEYKAGNNSTQGANTILHYYERAGIEAANLKDIYGQFADRKSMPLKYGKTYKISRWQRSFDRKLSDPDFAKKGFLSSRNIDDVTNGLNSIKLAEGATTGNKVDFQKVTIETSFVRYGEMIEYTDEVDMFSEDTMQLRYHEELGEKANLNYEDLIQLDMLGTPTVIYSGTGTSLATMGAGLIASGAQDDKFKISYNLIRRGVQRLTRNRAEKNTEIVTGSVKIDTRTINKAFYAIIGPEVKYDLESITKGKNAAETFAYIPAYQYADASKLANGEVGCMHEVRFIESETATVYAGQGAAIPTSYVGELAHTNGKFDVFPILFPTKGAFATVGLKGKNKIVFRQQSPDKVELGNPFGTKGFFSYNFWYAGIILQPERLLKMLVLATA